MWVPPKEGEHMRALREYMAKEADEIREENEKRKLIARSGVPHPAHTMVSPSPAPTGGAAKGRLLAPL